MARMQSKKADREQRSAGATRSTRLSEFQAEARVMAVEQAMLALSPSLPNHITALPDDIQRVAADHLRLSTGYGPDADARRFEQFSLSPNQFEVFGKWWRRLDRVSQDAILGVISK